LSGGDSAFEAAKILADLGVSASEMGYRAQALLAATLARMPGGIEVVARTGHPDIIARVAGRLFWIQAKATAQSTFRLSADDLAGIRSRSGEEEGYLAVLDLGPPVAWIFVPHARAVRLVDRTVPLAMLRTMQDRQLSLECSSVFVELVLERPESIEAHTFGLMRRRALAGNADEPA